MSYGRLYGLVARADLQFSCSYDTFKSMILSTGLIGDGIGLYFASSFMAVRAEGSRWLRLVLVLVLGLVLAGADSCASFGVQGTVATTVCAPFDVIKTRVSRRFLDLLPSRSADSLVPRTRS